MASSYVSLEKDYTSALGVAAPTFVVGGKTSLFASTSFLYSLAIMISVVAAGFMYARAGLWRMEASSRGITKSNEEIKRTTLGLLGVLSLFVILYTFNKGLLTGEVGLDNLRAKGFVSGGGGDMGGGGATGDTGGTATQTPTTNGTEAANWTALTNAGIIITSTTNQRTPCTAEQLKQSGPTCTSLIGMPDSVISMLLQLKSTCGTTFQITGGTEPGHKTHGQGKAAVDVDDDSKPLNDCIRKFPTGPTAGWSFCNSTFTKFGFVFCDEKGTSHWHVQQ